MKVVFVSNYYTHHQSELSHELYNALNGQYVFIQTTPMEQERVSLGWSIGLPKFVKSSYISQEMFMKCQEEIDNADVVIAGNVNKKMLKNRLKNNKIVFRYTERIFKKSDFDILRYLKYVMMINSTSKNNVYYLCSSAFSSLDYSKCGVDILKCYKWGYFPEVKYYNDVDRLINSKYSNSIIWVSRFINWKHPEQVIYLAKRLRDSGYQFQIKLIGTGKLKKNIEEMVSQYELQKNIIFLDSINFQLVRKHMEESQIFIFTSDRSEGWGAVLNEAMNSACAVVASNQIGSVPYLIKDNFNGMIYNNNQPEELFSKVKKLIDMPEKREKLSLEAYKTITQEWNAKVAVERLLNLIRYLVGDIDDILYEEGPCSLAEIMKCN